MRFLKTILARRSAVLCPLCPETSIRAAIQLMSERGVGVVPIVDQERLVGIFSERDLLHRVVARGLSLDTTTLVEVMTPDPVVAHAGESSQAAMLKMQRSGCRHLPIVKDDRLVDMLSLRDILRVELAEREVEIRDLQDYIQGSHGPEAAGDA